VRFQMDLDKAISKSSKSVKPKVKKKK
jgi:hypothetical protein